MEPTFTQRRSLGHQPGVRRARRTAQQCAGGHTVDAEVVASIGIMGRFSDRPYVYWWLPNSPIPIRTRTVIFVFDPAIEDEIPNTNAQDDVAAAAFVRDNLHTKPITDAAGITAFRWKAPAGTRSITLPGPPPTSR